MEAAAPSGKVAWDDIKINRPIYICKNCKNIPKLTITNSLEVQINCSCSKKETKKLSLSSFLEEMSPQKQPHECENKKKHSLPENAVAYCNDCKKWLCSSCLDYHNDFTSDHSVEMYEGMKINNKCENLNCTRSIQFYCENCQIHLCDECESSHDPLHTIVNINKIFTDEKINDCNKKIMEKIKEFEEENSKCENVIKVIEERIKVSKEILQEKKKNEENLIKLFGSLFSLYFNTKNINNFNVRNNLVSNEFDEFYSEREKILEDIYSIIFYRQEEIFPCDSLKESLNQEQEDVHQEIMDNKEEIINEDVNKNVLINEEINEDINKIINYQWNEKENFEVRQNGKIIKRIFKRGWPTSCVLMREKLQRQKINKWRIKVNKTNFDLNGLALGMIKKNEDLTKIIFYSLWLISGNGGYRTKSKGCCKDNIIKGSILDFCADLIKGTFEITMNGKRLGFWEKIPLNEDLVPCACLFYEGNEVEIVDI